MILSNFKLVEVKGKNALDWTYRATVDVTTGAFFKKTETKEIFKEFAAFWHFTDTGEFTPDSQAEKLVRIFEAKNGKMELQ